ncbi:hypothetical protein LJ753_16690 [Arthrobacter sp. zg-Y20]|uniref:hypothetical protein n=1 Tax=unclassified Arthrobacter TaxID=235627 RepID=UPI001D15A373|nr:MULTISPECIES: hypothetical protein [unclassified Arthrobacter]MCC3277503.1 hypothetical protein [Arthrobacter sp. zg-Y20]MDK1317663.1 hypothetical protein [Arthrobacter sp. zg.Y20]WIB07077.1 hypothetical protein QNO06_04935 [Arthrobacter sp. zg-Y20]
MSIWDPRYEAIVAAKTRVQQATVFVDAATVARPFNMSLLNQRMDELSAAHQALQDAYNQENAA